MSSNAYNDFKKLWPEDRHPTLKPILSQVQCFYFPEDHPRIREFDRKNTVVLYKEKHKNLVSFLVNGFEHIVCMDREDLREELLASALMILRPEPFIENPSRYFFNSFDPDHTKAGRRDNNLTINFMGTQQKDDVFKLLRDFWQRRHATAALEDLCLQIADEMFTNMFFNAPVTATGKRPYREVTRDTHVVMPENLKPKIFTSFSDTKVIVGCEDPFGSIIKEPILYRLESLYTEAMTSPREHTAGAGLGFKFLIDNSANFYLFSEKGRRTVFACGLILKGLKANLTANKSLHFAVN